MNLTIDIGNTAAKWAAFEGRTLVDHATGMPGDALVAGAGRVMVQSFEAQHGGLMSQQSVRGVVCLLDGHP